MFRRTATNKFVTTLPRESLSFQSTRLGWFTQQHQQPIQCNFFNQENHRMSWNLYYGSLYRPTYVVRSWSSSSSDSVLEENTSNKNNSSSQQEPTPYGLHLESKIRNYFPQIQNSELPLLADVETYLQLLPRRKILERGSLKLYECPYWVHKDDLSIMAKQLESTNHPARAVVKYIVAPTNSGKTASILPAFFRSTENSTGFTHYFYFAFNNNNGRYYKLAGFPDSDTEIAYAQGGAFMFECVKQLLECTKQEGPWSITRNDDPLTQFVKGSPPYAIEIQKYLISKKIRCKSGKEPRFLFHLDEHRKMCDMDDLSSKTSPSCAFRRGAMEALAYNDNITVVATYTEQPQLPADQSSGICRLPVSLPVLDISLAMKDIPELHFPESELKTRDQKRQFATLLFKLSMKLTLLGLNNLHSNKSREVIAFLNTFKNAVEMNMSNIDRVLLKCNELCSIGSNDLGKLKQQVHAQELLIGIEDNEIDHIFDRQIPSGLIVMDDMWTGSFRQLLRWDNPNYPIYDEGRICFEQMLIEPDFLSSTPLEVAYRWILSVKNNIQFLSGKRRFLFQCKELESRKIFSYSEKGISYDAETLKDLKQNVLYYPDETKGKSHPLCDLYFLSEKNQLVLIDITGGNNDATNDKYNKLSSWISAERKNINYYTLYGIVLAPCADLKSYSKESVQVICGADAKQLLGGLQQIFRWLVK